MSAADLTLFWTERASLALEAWESLGEGRRLPGAGFSDEACQIAYDLLASWKAIERLDPSRLDEEPGLAARLGALVARDAGSLSAASRDVADPAGWMEAFEDAEAVSVEPSADPDLVLADALQLLCDLDDADLVLCAFDSLVGADLDDYPVDLAAGVTACGLRLTEGAHVVLPAVAWARATLASARPGLGDADPALAATLTKHELVVEALRDFQHGLEAQPELPRARLEAAVRRARLLIRLKRLANAVPDLVRRIDLPVHQPVLLAGRTGGAGRTVLHWRGDGGWRALMTLPAPEDARDEAEVIVRFLDAPAAATEAFFQGACCTLEADGDYRVARFTLGTLRALAETEPSDIPALALLGSSGETWLGRRG